MPWPPALTTNKGAAETRANLRFQVAGKEYNYHEYKAFIESLHEGLPQIAQQHLASIERYIHKKAESTNEG